MPLTASQLTDLRADLGDQNTPYAFSDAELERLYLRTDESYESTVRLAIKQLLMNASKFYDYVSGHTRQEQEKIFQHLKDMYEIQTGETVGANQATIVGVSIIPPDSKEKPHAFNTRLGG